jgi:hypothetical protein
VTAERRLRILARLGQGDRGTRRVCEVCTEVLGTTGAGIMLMSNDAPRGSICTTDDVSSLIEDLQYELGEGPCIDAFHTDEPVLEPNLGSPVTPRWLAFTPPVLDAGARAVFGFPLRVGAVRLGALNLYCTQPGSLTDEQHADALVMADVAASAILALQAGAPPGKLAEAIEAGADFQYTVHQASGMVAAQLEISITEAHIRLRAAAFQRGVPLGWIADEVIARRLRLGDAEGKDS